MYIVYKTINKVNQKIYIGVHKTDTPYIFDGYYGSGIAINKAIKKYGKDKFIRKTIFTFQDKEQAFNKEAEIVNNDFIKLNNYNMRSGGNGGSTKPSEETKQKISNTLKGKMSGSKNPMYGIKGSKNPRYNTGKTIQQYGKCGNLIKEDFLSTFLKEGFSQSMISHCCAMRNKSHKGFIFKYKEDKSFIFPNLSTHGNSGIVRRSPSL